MSLPNITEFEYPGLFQASDDASKSAQKRYLQIVALDLFLMMLAAGIAIYNYSSTTSKEIVYIIAGILLLISLVLTIVVLTRKYEDIWYQGRALAESCKTLTWRFMLCSELFENSLPLEEAKAKFINKLKDIGKEFSDLNREMSAVSLAHPYISKLMLDVRSLSLEERKVYYIDNRITDQKNWYSKKAEWNKGKYILWFFVIIISQALSLISIAYLVLNPSSNWNFVGLFTTLASSAISWLQLKQHQNLKQAYTTAVLELNYILSLSSSINSESDLAKFVLDSENAISREHTLWIAQRRK